MLLNNSVFPNFWQVAEHLLLKLKDISKILKLLRINMTEIYEHDQKIDNDEP